MPIDELCGKRVIAGVISVVIIGVAIHLLWLPKKGSVEWHKKKYLHTLKVLNGEDWRNRFGRLLSRVTGRTPSFLRQSLEERDAAAKEHISHRVALLRLGYLRSTVIVFSNRPVERVGADMYGTKWPTEIDGPFVCKVDCEQTNAIGWIAPTGNLEQWEKFFRGLDVPESGKSE